MKAQRFSDTQKAFIPNQGTESIPVADVCPKAGISQPTYFNAAAEAAQDENNKLKWITYRTSFLLWPSDGQSP